MEENFSLNSNSVHVTKKVKKTGSPLSNWLIQKNIVRTQTQATLVQYGIIGISILVIIMLNWPSSQGTLEIDEKYYQDVILDE